ncbi:23S rRNA (guanosine2251-2'-O)-methyltransferase [Roseivirga ehrenbergii]|uniref:RNA methyltransferase n=2 Tax=Roseivirga ehrenbergii (strain DSM 102268 / JCM 13514 / KCTC 12282 / NCIMB 14502 / KMM 6017) TaxID=279360 RepID=A0A150WXD2_ROSEK|nr:23S rRNA (guanosine(2251)-2'-O)-methyltransferase RlmB [Roseivirga ehrenbergii]KYG71165.1 RNA methyltransferase [Roseivirga ehrenbergii]TCK99038.1 23S rRNA (guanosine2251-2'-O)-methyltransferase [Roseivirga ehrenbergii]
MMIDQPKDDFIYGSRAIIEAINAGKEIDKLLLQKDVKNELTTELLIAARDFNIPVQKVPIEKLNRITRKNHQGAVAFVSSVVYASLDNIISEAYSKGEVPLLIVLDRITDVRNFGAIARTAECVGAHGIVIPSRGNAQVGSDAMKTSAGALNFIPVCRADNLKTTLREIRDNGITVLACTEKASDLVYQHDLTVPIALLMGSEEDGISPEYLKLADQLCKLPIKGNIESLNVSVATSVVLYEVVRQRG